MADLYPFRPVISCFFKSESSDFKHLILISFFRAHARSVRPKWRAHRADEIASLLEQWQPSRTRSLRRARQQRNLADAQRAIEGEETIDGRNGADERC